VTKQGMVGKDAQRSPPRINLIPASKGPYCSRGRSRQMQSRCPDTACGARRNRGRRGRCTGASYGVAIEDRLVLVRVGEWCLAPTRGSCYGTMSRSERDDESRKLTEFSYVAVCIAGRIKRRLERLLYQRSTRRLGRDTCPVLALARLRAL
jgi:hypothetical protein